MKSQYQLVCNITFGGCDIDNKSYIFHLFIVYFLYKDVIFD